MALSVNHRPPPAAADSGCGQLFKNREIALSSWPVSLTPVPETYTMLGRGGKWSWFGHRRTTLAEEFWVTCRLSERLVEFARIPARLIF